ncbi:hypothetical protein ACWEPC_25355 [Nonomuraea sp. NPDC004297]
MDGGAASARDRPGGAGDDRDQRRPDRPGAEHEALAAFHGDNYLPLLDRFYRSHRGLLLRLAGVLVLEPASTDRRLLEALEFVRANATRTSELIGDE